MKSNVNHVAVQAKAATNRDIVIMLTEHIWTVNLFLEKHNVDVYEKEDICKFLDENRGAKLCIGNKTVVLGRSIDRLANTARQIEGIIPSIGRMFNAVIAAELVCYLHEKDAEVQQEEYETNKKEQKHAM